jgi:N-acetylglutamate synthase-like GNAT family acetyltransferase
MYIRNIIVDGEKQGRGIGQDLMKVIEKTGKRLGGHKMYLFTVESWTATKFYKKLGFKKIANLPKLFFKRDFVIYSKSI